MLLQAPNHQNQGTEGGTLIRDLRGTVEANIGISDKDS